MRVYQWTCFDRRAFHRFQEVQSLQGLSPLFGIDPSWIWKRNYFIFENAMGIWIMIGYETIMLGRVTYARRSCKARELSFSFCKVIISCSLRLNRRIHLYPFFCVLFISYLLWSTCANGNIYQFYYLTTTGLRTQPCATRLVDECQVGTPIRRSLLNT